MHITSFVLIADPKGGNAITTLLIPPYPPYLYVVSVPVDKYLHDMESLHNVPYRTLCSLWISELSY